MQGDVAGGEDVDYALLSQYKTIPAADRALLGSSSSRSFSGKGATERNGRTSSTRFADCSDCVGTCPCSRYAHYHHNIPQPAIPSSGSTSQTHHWNAHHVNTAYQRAPAWVTWQDTNVVTCQTTHSFHHHHYYHYWEWPGGMEGPIGRSHAGTATDSGCEMNDLSSHEGTAERANECPAKPTPPSPVAASHPSKRFVEKEDDLYAAPPSLTVFKALHHCSSPQLLTPLPSSPHGLPLVLCHHCSHLLRLPPSSTLLLPSVHQIHHRLHYIKLQCGHCLKISKFSTRHLHRAPPSPPTAGSPLPPGREPVEITSMPSSSTAYGIPELRQPLNDFFKDSNCVTSKLPINGNGKHIQECNNREAGEHCNGVCVPLEGIEAGEPLNSICEYPRLPNDSNGEHSQRYGKLKTGEYFDGVSEHALKEEHIEAGEPLDGACGDSTQLKHVETGSPGDGKYGHALHGDDVEMGVFFNGVPEPSLEQNNMKTEAHMDGNYRHSSQVKDVETREVFNGTPDCSSEHSNIKSDAHSNGASVLFGVSQHESQTEREQEITSFSSVQDWVDSLTIESGHESDSQLQGPLNSHRSPLHQHFGYNSPSELFEKVFSSEDDETKTRTESNSIASSSSSPINACQQSEIKIASMPVHNLSLRSWDATNRNPGSSLANGCISPKCIEQDAQRSLAGFVKRGLMQKGRLLSSSPKTRVVVNGHVLSSAAVRQAEERAGKLRMGSYWYDCKAGFWGVEGGPCLGILPPSIEELDYPMLKNCSNGDTQVYVNGRELHIKDLAVLSQRGLSRKAGRAYALGFDGVLIDETTGLELKRLGKLAPTVERRGKGFGMFTAHVLK